MSNKDKLISYYQTLCNALNENGYRVTTKVQGKPYETNYEVDEEHPDLNAMAITMDISAYRFLKDQGLIDKSLCHFCGNSPVDGTYTFTESNNQIAINICDQCHTHEKNLRGGSNVTSKSGSGCMVTLSIVFLALIILICV